MPEKLAECKKNFCYSLTMPEALALADSRLAILADRQNLYKPLVNND